MTSPSSLLTSSGLRPKKQYGQNFLKDPSTARMIVDRAGLSAADVVLEIGPGLGALTIPAANRAKRVIAVEKDKDMASVLETELKNQGVGNVVLVNADILTVDISAISRQEGRKLIVIGNLPYNISSQIVISLIHARQSVERAMLMFQKEVAQRLAVGPGGKEYGRLSVMLQYCAEVRKAATVGAHLFLPKPKVASEVIEVRFRETLDAVALDERLLSAVVKAAFSTRRKTLRNALANIGQPMNGSTIAAVLANAGIDPNRRAETLSVAEFVTLANCFYALIGPNANEK